jgi:hypothetical protein
VALSRHDQEVVVEERSSLEVGAESVVVDADTRIELAAAQPLLDVVPVRPTVQVDPGGPLVEAPVDVREQGEFDVVGRADRERAVERLGIESLLRLEEGRDVRDQLSNVRFESLGASRLHHLIAGPDQQRILEDLAQSRQRVTRRRRAEVESVRSLLDALGLEECTQFDE